MRRRYSAGASSSSSRNKSRRMSTLATLEQNGLDMDLITDYLPESDKAKFEQSLSSKEMKYLFKDLNLNPDKLLKYMVKKDRDQFLRDFKITRPQHHICLHFEGIDFSHPDAFQMSDIPMCKEITFKNCTFPPNTNPRDEYNLYTCFLDYKPSLLSDNFIEGVTSVIMHECRLVDSYFLRNVKRKLIMENCLITGEGIQWLINIPAVYVRHSRIFSPNHGLFSYPNPSSMGYNSKTKYLDLTDTKSNANRDLDFHLFKNLHTLILANTRDRGTYVPYVMNKLCVINIINCNIPPRIRDNLRRYFRLRVIDSK
jgi:hypothetical protein